MQRAWHIVLFIGAIGRRKLQDESLQCSIKLQHGHRRLVIARSLISPLNVYDQSAPPHDKRQSNVKYQLTTYLTIT